MNETKIRKQVEIDVPQEVVTEAERRAKQQGGLVENYLNDQVRLEIEWNIED